MSSFSTKVKDEISTLNETSSIKELLMGMLQINASMNLSQSGLSLEYKTKNLNVVNLLENALKERYKIDALVYEGQEKRLKKETIYQVLINQNAAYILRDLSIMQAKEDSTYSLKKEIVDDELRIAYLKGAFLSCGSLNDPESNTYHLEIQTFNTIVATNLSV